MEDGSNNNYILKDLKKNFLNDWKFLLGLLSFSIIFHIILWLGWPLHPGADANTYIYYFFDSFNQQPVYHNLMTFRTPLAPFFNSLLLLAGGKILASVVLEVMVLLSSLFTYFTVVLWGKLYARIASIIITLMVAYQIQFHQIGADALFSFLVLLTIFYLAYAIKLAKPRYWFITALLISLVTLARPGGITFLIVLIIIPFTKLGIKKIIATIGIFILITGAVIGGYVIYKGIRYDDYSVARGFGHALMYRIYRIQDNSLSEENGPNSEKLLKIIDEELLTKKVYRDYDVSLEDFLTYKPNSRLHGDLISITDTVEGWDSNYELLLKSSIESIIASPKIFLKTYILDIEKLVTENPSIPDVPLKSQTTETELNENGLPVPTEGEIIPYANQWWMSTRPDGSRPTREEIENLESRSSTVIAEYTSSEGSIKISNILNYLWERFYIPISYFWLLGIFGIFFSRKRNRLFLIALFLILASYIMFTLIGTPPWLKYRLTLDPVIIIFGLVGLKEIISRTIDFKRSKSR